MTLNIKISVGIVVLFLLFSCKTYTIPTDSFRNQMIGSTSKSMTNSEINNPVFSKNIRYSSNNIDQIEVVDKKGKIFYLDNSPSIEMRVTDLNGKKYQLYFDTVILENDTLKGGRSRFVQGLKREIPMENILKIEVQDGGKNFNYNKK